MRDALDKNPYRQFELLVEYYFDVGIDQLTEEQFWKLYVEALWLEEREINRFAAAIGKAFGGEK